LEQPQIAVIYGVLMDDEVKRWRIRHQKKIENHINFRGNGLEIGPGYLPLYPKSDGYKVKILDHVSEEELKRKYNRTKLNLDEIEKVNFIWNGEPYVDLVNEERFDWIVASQVIEHVPDFIGFINECDSILKENGVLVLFVPDRRYTLDYFRSTSSLASIIDAHVIKRTRPSPGNVLDALLLETNPYKDSNNPYDKYLNFLETPNQDLYQKYIEFTEYKDIHIWVFTPSHFRMIIENLFLCGTIKLRERICFPSERREFCIILSRSGNGPNLSRLELARKICQERKVNILKAGRGTSFVKNVIPVYLKRLYKKVTGNSFLRLIFRKKPL
jgi:2-polyprenyl-3-methyl-5-hydroxy-6-metoxy-1,4-benzoquinol methylase